MNDSSESNKESREGNAWLLLIHQIPPKPDYLRVKVRRRLHKIGALPLKQSVYLLPNTESSTEDFQWLRAEIMAEGGDATVCEATFIEGLSDAAVEELFRRDRASRYEEIVFEAKERIAGLTGSAGERREIVGAVQRLRARLDEIREMDFFGVPNAGEAVRAVAELERRATEGARPSDVMDRSGRLVGATWVTRHGVHIDRIASAWLIRRFIDEEAVFKFVPSRGYSPEPGEQRFDMYEGEFTHEGDSCTFETLLVRFGLSDTGLRRIAEIVHELDCKDGKYVLEEAPGVQAMIAGIVVAHTSDSDRLQHGAVLFDHLLTSFRARANTDAASEG